MKTLKLITLLLVALSTCCNIITVSESAFKSDKASCSNPPEAICGYVSAILDENCQMTVSAQDVDAGSWDDRTIPADLHLEIAVYQME